MLSEEKGRRVERRKGEKEGRNNNVNEAEVEAIYTESCEMVSRARLPFDEIESQNKKRSQPVRTCVNLQLILLCSRENALT